MALQSFLSRVSRVSGVEAVSPSFTIDPALRSEYPIKIDANRAQWDDPTLFVTVTLEESFDDGKTWVVYRSVTFPGILGTKPGTDGLPAFGYTILDGDKRIRLARARMSANKNKSCGLTIDL